jgi:hypothetical protein
MASAKQCDRCGKFYTKHLNNKITVRREQPNESIVTKTLELCPDCMGAFDNYMSSDAYDRLGKDHA